MLGPQYRFRSGEAHSNRVVVFYKSYVDEGFVVSVYDLGDRESRVADAFLLIDGQSVHDDLR